MTRQDTTVPRPRSMNEYKFCGASSPHEEHTWIRRGTGVWCAGERITASDFWDDCNCSDPGCPCTGTKRGSRYGPVPADAYPRQTAHDYQDDE